MLGELTREFLERGADPDLPTAVVENATRRSQRVVTGTIGSIVEKVEEAGIKGPALTVIGTVVTLRGQLNWYQPGSAASDEGDCLRSMPLDPIETSEFA